MHLQRVLLQQKVQAFEVTKDSGSQNNISMEMPTLWKCIRERWQVALADGEKDLPKLWKKDTYRVKEMMEE